jgi:hypothetical protein
MDADEHRSTEPRAGRSCTQIRQEALTGVVLFLRGGWLRPPGSLSQSGMIVLVHKKRWV